MYFGKHRDRRIEEKSIDVPVKEMRNMQVTGQEMEGRYTQRHNHLFSRHKGGDNRETRGKCQGFSEMVPLVAAILKKRNHLGAGLALAGDLERGGGASRGRGPEGDPWLGEWFPLPPRSN